MRISDWSSDVCSSDLETAALLWPEPTSVRGEERLSLTTTRLEPPARVLRDAPSTSSGAPQDERDSLSVSQAVDALSAATRSDAPAVVARSEEHTSELQSLMRISYAVFCLQKNRVQQS